MIKYLLKTTEMYRIETLDDVKKWHEEVLRDAVRQRYTLNSFSYQEKNTKDGDSYYVVKCVKAFEKEKDPDLPLKEITYTTYVEEINTEMEDMDMEEDFE